MQTKNGFANGQNRVGPICGHDRPFDQQSQVGDLINMVIFFFFFLDAMWVFLPTWCLLGSEDSFLL